MQRGSTQQIAQAKVGRQVQSGRGESASLRGLAGRPAMAARRWCAAGPHASLAPPCPDAACLVGRQDRRALGITDGYSGPVTVLLAAAAWRVAGLWCLLYQAAGLAVAHRLHQHNTTHNMYTQHGAHKGPRQPQNVGSMQCVSGG